MNKSIKLIAVSFIVAGIASVSLASGAHAASTKVCTVKAAPLGSWGKNITVTGNTATAKFTVEGTDCTTPVTLASWIRPTAEGINDQKLFKHSTATFGPGVHSLTVAVADCMYQVDVVKGSRATAADGTANYQYQNGKFVDGGLRDFKKGGTGVCKDEVKPPVVVPPVVTPPVVPTPTPSVATPSAPVVTSLPSTGTGDILAGVTGIGTSVTAAISFVKSRHKVKLQ